MPFVGVSVLMLLVVASGAIMRRDWLRQTAPMGVATAIRIGLALAPLSLVPIVKGAIGRTDIPMPINAQGQAANSLSWTREGGRYFVIIDRGEKVEVSGRTYAELQRRSAAFATEILILLATLGFCVAWLHWQWPRRVVNGS